MKGDSSSAAERELQDRLDLSSDRSAAGRRSRWVMATAALVVVTGTALFLLSRGQEGPRFVTAAAERGALKITVSATGALEPVNQVDVGTEVSGTIRTVAVDFNDRVSRGQVLARLDTDELKAQVLQGRASLRSAEARVAQTRATVEETKLKEGRCLELARKAMCTQEDLDAAHAGYLRAEADVASAEAQVEVARAALGAHQTRLEKAQIRSPIDGLVLARRIEPGQTVAASLQTPVLFVLAEDLADMELHIDVDEADVGLVKERQPATFTVDAYPDRRFPATITQVRFAPDTEGGVVTYETVLQVDNEQLLLRPGMTATAEIIVAEISDALLVPNASLRYRPPAEAEQGRREGGIFGRMPPRGSRSRTVAQNSATIDDASPVVWVMRDAEPEAVAVQTGLTDGALTQIVGGQLTAGDILITGVDPGKT
jgi:HlyD family secretion protein